eukprot:TRINITY_DN6473_c0_g1_i2.p1 TRINITY_DN6473_c0_g1~~TRINITY_DN6473_c0_g1_i2.p1  ORF type:complete len:437 (+),score=122.96 TRINITY_DN6473_c0_g1_i2:366-1676(+)
MLTTLLTPRKTPSAAGTAPPNIEVLSTTPNPDAPAEEEDWSFEQHLPQEESPELLLGKPHYGFNDAYTNFFPPLQEEISEIVDLADPDNVPAAQRRVLRMQQEDAKFYEQQDHYMMDFVDDTEVTKALEYTPVWCTEREHMHQLRRGMAAQASTAVLPNDSASLTPASLANMVAQAMDVDAAAATSTAAAPVAATGATSASVTSTPVAPTSVADDAFAAQNKAQKLEESVIYIAPEQVQALASLPKKEYLVSNMQALLCGLMQVLYGYAYDMRATQGEHTVESAWTVAKLSPLLSWLDPPCSLQDSVVGCLRRALAFPLYRNWKLAKLVVRDTADILRLGPRAVVRSLLEVRDIFLRSENRHYLNTLFIDDYCCWVQTLPRQGLWTDLADELMRVDAAVAKADVGWSLDELEKQAVEELANAGPAQEGAEDERRPL